MAVIKSDEQSMISPAAVRPDAAQGGAGIAGSELFIIFAPKSKESTSTHEKNHLHSRGAARCGAAFCRGFHYCDGFIQNGPFRGCLIQSCLVRNGLVLDA